MADEIEKIDEIFRMHDEKQKDDPQTDGEKSEPERGKKEAVKAVDSLFIDKDGNQIKNYTGDAESERDYRPVRQSHEYRSGCLGGLMYFIFVMCVSVIFACFLWMAVSDALALNKKDITATVVLPAEIFETELVESLDEDGNTVSKEVSYADINYVTSTLKENGIIEYKWLFEFFCKISHADAKLDPGEYELKTTYDYRALIKKMQSGNGAAVTVKVTIPEGFTMNQIFLRLEENGVCEYENLMEAAANYTYNYSFLEGIEPGNASRLEGFLFPDTYEFYMGEQASSVINKFLRNFNSKVTADMIKQCETRGISLLDAVKIASLIEKEAAVDPELGVDERGTISSVIYNRIASQMSLGLESSILYVHQDYEGAPTAEMLEEDTPYNLNKYTGLPPTPICNPSLAAIEATLAPESTGYYYFTLDTATGAHRFFVNYYEFQNFVATQNYDG